MPEWLIAGDALEESVREWVIHATPPRFIARIVPTDEDGRAIDPCDADADLISGLTYSFVDGVLCEFEWIDEPPTGDGLLRLMQGAATAIEIYTQDSDGL